MLKQILLLILSIISYNSLFSQEAAVRSPKVMVVPTDRWYKENNYYTMNNGEFLPNYETAFYDSKTLSTFITKMNGLMKDRGIDIKSLEEVLKTIKVEDAEVDVLKGGLKNITRDKILNKAKPDIIIYVYYPNTPISSDRGSVYSQIDVEIIDAFTGIALSSIPMRSNPEPMSNANLNMMNEKALISGINDLISKLRTSFDEMIEFGRPIKVLFNIMSGSAATFDDEVGANDEELSEIIHNWMKANTVKQSVNRGSKTTTQIDYNPKIDLKYEDAEVFIKPIKAELKKFGLTCKTDVRGPGVVRVMITENKK